MKSKREYQGATMRRVYQVHARWDSEGGVWVAESDDVPGLLAEAESPNALAQKLRVLIPELLELNGALESASGPVEFMVRYAHEETGVAALAS
jgi:predicted RNase H-like HicB family nuclease